MVGGTVLCLSLFPAFLILFFSFFQNFSGAMDFPALIVLNGLNFEFKSAASVEARPEDSYWLYFAVVAASGVMLVLAQKSVAFVFLAFHFALSILCVSLNLLVFTPLPEKNLLIEKAVWFSFLIVLLSQLAFISFHKGSVESVMRLIASIFLSSIAFTIGCIVLALVAHITDGALLMFLTYIILSYGIFGMHVISLVLLVD